MKSEKKLILASVICCSFLSVAFIHIEETFFIKASQANLAEIQAGKLAIARGSGKIKEYGNKEVSDHQAAQQELIIIANRQHLALAMSPDKRHLFILDSLKQLSGKSFDAAYVRTELDNQKENLAFFSDEAVSGSNSAAKLYAGKYMPILKIQLEMFKGDSSGMSMSVDSGKAANRKR